MGAVEERGLITTKAQYHNLETWSGIDLGQVTIGWVWRWDGRLVYTVCRSNNPAFILNRIANIYALDLMIKRDFFIFFLLTPTKI